MLFNIKIIIRNFLSLAGFLIVFFMFLNPAYGEITFYGSLMPGGILFAEGENIKEVFLDAAEIKNYDGVFVIGFDRDDKGTLNLKLVFKDGKTVKRELRLSEREYIVQRISGLPPSRVTLDDDTLQRIAAERKLFQTARERSLLTQKAYYKKGVMRPVEGGRISGVFGSRRILNGAPRSPHNGVDIALPTGSPVYAMTDGIAEITGDFFFGGKTVMLNHGHGLISFYMHLDTISARQGKEVKKGGKIGEVGMTGRATGPHVHWGVQWGGKRIDPLTLLNTGFAEKTDYYIEINTQQQKLFLYRDSKLIKTYGVSTSKYGIGNKRRSFKTPSGLHRISQKIGAGAPEGTIFKGRINQGKKARIYRDKRTSSQTLILTRIFRLEGVEPGVNKGKGIDSFSRFIYIHGAQEEGLIGTPSSRGSIRMKNADIIEIFDIVAEGTFVRITD